MCHAIAQRKSIGPLLEPGRWQNVPLAVTLRETFPVMVAVYRAKQGLIRAFLEQASEDARFREAWSEAGDFIVERVTQLVLARPFEIDHPNPERGLQLCLGMTFATLAHQIQMHGMDRPEMARIDRGINSHDAAVHGNCRCPRRQALRQSRLVETCAREEISMTYDDRFRKNSTLGVRVIKYAIAIMLALTTTAGFASEPLTYYGFDESSHSAAAREGMEEIFSGRLFHGGVPVATARMMLSALAGLKKNLGYDPDSAEGRFYASGRFPSPPNRTIGADPMVSAWAKACTVPMASKWLFSTALLATPGSSMVRSWPDSETTTSINPTQEACEPAVTTSDPTASGVWPRNWRTRRTRA